MNRREAVGTLLGAWPSLAAGSTIARPGGHRGEVLATRLFTVADDFVIDVYHNGLKVPDAQRSLLVERFGATAERIDLQVRRGDWLVFNVVNNRLRWGGCSYFGVVGRGDSGISFTIDVESGRWSCCDDPGKVNQLVPPRPRFPGRRAGSSDLRSLGRGRRAHEQRRRRPGRHADLGQDPQHLDRVRRAMRHRAASPIAAAP
ncbi:MAG: hypothetical protein U0790_20880 [Isosphaeraceae bacterium]